MGLVAVKLFVLVGLVAVKLFILIGLIAVKLITSGGSRSSYAL